ncbi:MAG: methylenetetrahydrofolate reductase [Planctomycetes bacterium]|nr:methylenetetrahydrofolate reductase [Planctomycetota bacterium]
MPNLFRNKLINSEKFLLTFELVPGANSKGKRLEKVLSFAEKVAQSSLLDALTITDNAGGNPSLSPDVLGREIKQMGIEPIVHFSCRDWNRYGAFSRALQLDRMGLENLLVMSGDYPAQGKEGKAKPVFDLDSVTALCMLAGLNRRRGAICADTAKPGMEKTNFLLGTTVSCLKFAESEVITQYYKLLKKIRNGASFVVTQICYDARKFHELISFVRQAGYQTPLFGSVCILTPAAARFITQGDIPGIYIPEKLSRKIEEDANTADNGKAAAIDRAAKLLAILKGLGYRGAHIVGGASYETLNAVIGLFHRIESQWRNFVPEFDFPYPGGFYLYAKDPETGLNKESLSNKRKRLLSAYIAMTIMKGFHYSSFDKTAFHYPLLKRAAKSIDKSSVLTSLLCAIENSSKKILFDCRKCGDCALDNTAYLCPESQCPKFMRNGPCGGSEKGFCEVKKEKTCVWVRIYERYKAHNELDRIKNLCIPPRNWSLDKTSSWLNLYLDRDYHKTIQSVCERKKQL